MPEILESSIYKESQLYKPIIILGAARSGTTILSKILAQHNDVALLIEPRMTWRYGNDRKSDMLLPADASPQIIKYIRRKFAAHLRNKKKQRLVEKTPSNSLRPAFVDIVLPEARYIHIIRNGYDACLATESFWDNHASGLADVAEGRTLQRIRELGPLRLPYYLPEFARRVVPDPINRIIGPTLWGPRLPGMSSMVREMDPIAVACLQWRTCVELSCQFGRSLPKERYFEIKLEDINSETVNEMLVFCELPNDDNINRFINETFDANRSNARQICSDASQLNIARSWIEPTLHWLGYE